MKKTLSIVLVTMLALIMCSTAVFATTSFTVALTADSTKVEKGGEVTVTVSLKNFTAGETGINALYAVIDYDKKVFEALEPANITAANGWGSVTYNDATGEAVTDNSSFMAEDHEAFKMKFKVKADAAVGNTVITVKNVEASDAATDIYPTDQKITLTIQEKAAAPEQNQVNNQVQNNVQQENVATQNPSTGIEDFTVPAVLAISVLAIIAYVRYTRLEK